MAVADNGSDQKCQINSIKYTAELPASSPSLSPFHPSASFVQYI